eukprot:6982433-Heterocapsa_arctica.AAC.2
MLCKYVVDIKIAVPKEITLQILAFLECVFGKHEVKLYEFTNCGIRRRQKPTTYECELDETEFIAEIKPIVSTEIAAAQADQVLSEALRSHYISLLMTLAYALMTRLDLACYVAALQKAA